MIVRIIIGFIHVYRRAISPFLLPRCRFDPTCSRYAIHALEHFGLLKGSWLALRRLFRCHPFQKDWGYDPIPLPAEQNNQQKSSTQFPLTKTKFHS